MKIDTLDWQDFEPYLIKARRQSTRTASKYKSCFKYLQLWFEEKELNVTNFSIFLTYLESNGISPAHQNNYIKFIKHLTHFLGNYEDFKDFPLVQVPDSRPEYILTQDEILRLANVKIPYRKYKAKKFKIKALILLLGNVGSRLDETLKLEWSDIIKAPVPMIYFRKENTKTKRERYCPIPTWLYEMLLKLPRESHRIFPLIDSANFRKDLEERSRLAGIPYKVKPSTFRDSSINNKLSYGMPIQEVGAYHGHVKIDTTFRYYTLIQATQMAQTLQDFDPAYQRELTFESVVDNMKAVIERRVNSNVIDYVHKTLVNGGKKEVWFGMVQK